MKVIFIKDLKKQGRVNDIKEVSDGYATNFLIKNGYAVKYTKTSMDILNHDMEKKKKDEENNIRISNELKKKIESIKLEFKVSSNNGRVFGSISAKQISDELKKLDISVDKKMININNPINSLGVHQVIVNLHKSVSANLSVHVISK